MQFNSIEFLLFLPIVYLIYWYLLRSSLRWQNVFVIVASYVFYGWWNCRLLGLIIFTSFLGWGGGLLTERVDRRKAKVLVGLNVAINLAILAVFKYYNFFVENLVALVESMGGGNSHLYPQSALASRHQLLYLPDAELCDRCLSWADQGNA